MDAATQLDRALQRGRASGRQRVARLRFNGWHVVQSGAAAGVAWWIAADLLDHPSPFFAPIAAVLSLGTSYGQRLRRVVEVRSREMELQAGVINVYGQTNIFYYDVFTDRRIDQMPFAPYMSVRLQPRSRR